MRRWLPQTVNIISSSSLLALLVLQYLTAAQPEKPKTAGVPSCYLNYGKVLDCVQVSSDRKFTSHVEQWLLNTELQHSCKPVSGEFHYISYIKLRLIWFYCIFLLLVAVGLPILARVAGVICHCCFGVCLWGLGRLTCCQSETCGVLPLSEVSLY